MDTNQGIHLKNVSNFSGQFGALAGLCALGIGFMAATLALQGNWRGLPWLLLPAGIVAFGKWIDHMTPEFYAVLYPDRVEFPSKGASQGVFEWSEVEGIRWPRGRDREISIRIRIPPTKRWPIGSVLIELKNVSPEDRLTLMRYLRKAGADVEQNGWPQFCLNRAVPLVDFCQKKNAGGTVAEDSVGSPYGEIDARFSGLIERHPFLAGLAAPITLLFIIPKTVSRKTWWTMSALLAASALINIRLIWGGWISPFTEICLGVGGATFVLGLLASKSVPASRGRGICEPAVLFWLGVLFVGLPFFGNAAVLGWVPQQVARVGLVPCFLLTLAPLIMLTKQDRREKTQAPAREADALRRWVVYERTGELPESELPY